MKLEWIGRHRHVVAALVRHSNVVNRALTTKQNFGDGIYMSAQELQILENLIEHDGEKRIMLDVAADLGIPRSTMTKATKQLLTEGLVTRYRLEGNKKSVVLRVSPKGVAFYKNYQKYAEIIFKPLFDGLKDFSDEQLESFAKALTALNDTLDGTADKKLIDY